MTTKNDDYTQFARVATAFGEKTGGASPSNDGVSVLTDGHGRLITIPLQNGSYIITLPSFTTQGVVTYAQIKVGSTIMYKAWGSQDTGNDLWIHFHNQNGGVPAGVPDSSPIYIFKDDKNWMMDFREGITFGNGLAIAYSTTFATTTLPGTGGFISVLYR